MSNTCNNSSTSFLIPKKITILFNPNLSTLAFTSSFKSPSPTSINLYFLFFLYNSKNMFIKKL